MTEQLWQAVMPYIAPKNNLIEFFQSTGEINVPFLLIDNSPNGDSRDIALPKNVEVEYHPEGLSVPASWNKGLKKGAKWTLIISASVRFGGRFKDFIDGCTKRASAYGLNPRMAMHLYVIGRATVDEIGYFDEHYKPSYYDDTSYWRRMILGKITGDGLSELPYFHPEYVICVGDAVALKSGAIRVDFQRNLEFYKRKWGGEPTQETFDHPYNNPSLPLSYTGDPL